MDGVELQVVDVETDARIKQFKVQIHNGWSGTASSRCRNRHQNKTI